MYYIGGANTPIYVTHTPEIAALLADKIQGRSTEFPEAGKDMGIDFGGCLVENMQTIELIADSCQFHFYAHHLSDLTVALRSGLDGARKFIIIPGGNFCYTMTVEAGRELLEQIQTHWETYKVLENQNIALWQAGMQAMSACPAVDVRRELGEVGFKGEVL